MIDPRELRLGNLVLTKTIKYNETHCEVTHIGKGGSVVLVIPQELRPHPIERNAEHEIFPILLTEEFFEKRMGYERLIHSLISFRTDQTIGYNSIYVTKINTHTWLYNTGGVAIEMKYLHQFQNITFIFTGQELTITETVKE